MNAKSGTNWCVELKRGALVTLYLTLVMVAAPYTKLISTDGGGDPIARFNLEHPATDDSDDSGAGDLFKGIPLLDAAPRAADGHRLAAMAAGGPVEAAAAASLLKDDPARSLGEREAELAEHVPLTEQQTKALMAREGTADAPNAAATAERDAAIRTFVAEHGAAGESTDPGTAAGAATTETDRKGGVPLTEYTDGLGPHFGKGAVAESTAGTGHAHGAMPASKECPDCPLPHAWMVPAPMLNTCKYRAKATYGRVGYGASKGCAKKCKWPRMVAAQGCTPDPPFVARVPFPRSKAEFRKPVEILQNTISD